MVSFPLPDEDSSLADVVELDDPGEMPTLHHHNHPPGLLFFSRDGGQIGSHNFNVQV